MGDQPDLRSGRHVGAKAVNQVVVAGRHELQNSPIPSPLRMLDSVAATEFWRTTIALSG
ncbi:hypothetical protein J2857_001401 [Neorhizobium galegae]|uniref:hypothetical protein n=1 Tax=Neorhizobium galegae TaxID=399 RepID=UPI001AE52E56|nr:hypothetical protein [Neorhizobium galegae]MBP2558650.1 hypothetical protein [Neorhizobium galegae]